MPRKYQKLFSLSNEHSKGISSVAFSPHGSFVATAGLDGKVCWWDMENGDLLYAWAGDSAVLRVVWVPEQEDSIICGLKDGNVAVCRVTKDAIHVSGFWAHQHPVECIAIDGDRVATGAHKEIKIWRWNVNTRHFTLIQDLPEPPKSSHNKDMEVLVTSLHWTAATIPGAHRLLMATYMYHGVQFFDAVTGDITRTFPIPGMIASASLSPNGAYLAVSNVFKGFDVYKVQSEKPIASFEYDEPSSLKSAGPIPVLFIHGGRALVGGSMVGKVCLWHVNFGKMHNLALSSERPEYTSWHSLIFHCRALHSPCRRRKLPHMFFITYAQK
ncbi:WD40-repeat-containing domain protein [Daedaleopsis nitida]|nr:WD40-repeat-containing domain protein [Daedaleopsis nitida]